MQLYRRLLWGMPEGVAAVEAAPLTLQAGQFHLRVIETPGHSRDHISLFETKHRWLFSGDAFIGGRDRTWLREVDMFSVISSLRTLAALRPEKLFPGSGNVRQKAQPEIDGKIAYLLGLCQDVNKLDALKMPTREIVERLLGGETRMRFWTQGHFSGHNLVEACRAYNRIFDPAADAQQPANDGPSGPSPRPSSDPSASREGKGSE
jgi:glyoxylase-like metal-dependent hydrolase (beta-lactamase superfamily II)